MAISEAFTLFALVTVFLVAQGATYKSERELRRDIFRDYDKNVRPVKRASTAVPFKINISLLRLLSMDEKESTIVLDSWVKMSWTDEYLQWDPTEYDNITELRIPPDQVWKPDFALYTANPTTSLFPQAQTNVIIYNSGMVLWVPPFTLESICIQPSRSIMNKNFVECNLRFGSWTYSGKLLDIQLETDTVDMSEFIDINSGWKVSKAVINRESKYYPCCPEDYPLVHLNVTLKRRMSKPVETPLSLFK